MLPDALVISGDVDNAPIALEADDEDGPMLSEKIYCFDN